MEPNVENRSIELLIFDLDGTLIDSKLDIANAVNAAREHMGFGPLDHAMIAAYVGNGAPVLIRRALGPQASDADVEKALAFFIAYYQEHKLDYTTLYPGVRETLDQLHAAGRRLAILTNKPVRISKSIIEGLALQNHFERVYGGNSFSEKKPHPIGIQTLMAELSTQPDATLMVGDSAVDVRTARNANVLACGVTFGFQPETFHECPPDFLIDHMPKLAEIVL